MILHTNLRSFLERVLPLVFWATTSSMLLIGAPRAKAQFLGPQPETMQPPTSPKLISGSPEAGPNMILLPGDLFEVQIFGVPQFDYKGRLSDDGDVALPLVGKIHLADQSLASAEQSIAAKLTAAELIKDPQVSITVIESPNHFATVTGEVKSPGAIPIYGEKHLLDVISSAGGFTPVSSPLVTIYRRGNQQPFQIKIPADPAVSGRYNILISPGDNIVISKVGVVYVIGAVRVQGSIPLKTTTPLTLIEAMSLAGGVNFEAALGKAYILRVASEGRHEIPFNVADVLKHRAEDQVLQSDDIILIPSSGMKAALKGGAAAVAASLVAGVGYITVR